MTLFDPSEGGPRTLSLVRLSSELARSVAAVGRVAVEGEVVRPRLRPSGRTYFTLRDRAAQIQVTFSGARARRCRAVHGERVTVTGSVVYGAGRGEVALEAEEVTPLGSGAIAAMVDEARRRLRSDGILDRSRRPLPLLPRLVGVVCGADAAVRADITSVVADRFPGYPVRFCEVSVSGAGAAESIIGALRTLRSWPELDVVIVARGGGDAASLLPFSDEALCRAMAAFPVPVAVAIGHEEDRPLCDEVADHRFATPSLAATAVIPSRRALVEALAERRQLAEALLVRAAQAATTRLDRVDLPAAVAAGAASAAAGLERARGRLHLVGPGRRVAASRHLLERVDRRSGLAHHLSRAAGQLADRHRTLEAVDPARPLRRGYAVVRDRHGRVVTDAAAVEVGDLLALELAAGTLDVEVRGRRG
jgi:exodeoxyribonuclease VII large subunit